MLRIAVIFLLLLVSLTGCDHRAKQVAFGTREVALLDGYYGADPKTAEGSLQALSAHLLNGQKQQLENRDYDWTLALTHGRLALLYQHFGRAPEAEKQFGVAFAHMDRSAAHRKIRAPKTDQEKRETLVRLITLLDKNREVKWKEH